MSEPNSSPAHNPVEATFLFADIAGYTALTEAHGDEGAAATAARLVDLAEESLDSDSRVLRSIGDAVMIIAPTPESAIRSALALRSASEAEELFPAVHLGLHAGTAIPRGGDYFGATVNLAARIAGQAAGDQIMCSRQVATVGRAMDGIEILALGRYRLKNITHEVELFEIRSAALGGSGLIDPVCRMRVDPDTAPARLPFEAKVFHFCSFQCASRFVGDPHRYTSESLGPTSSGRALSE